MHRLFTEEKAMFFCAFPASSPSSSFVCASVLCAPGPVSPFSPPARGRPRSSAVFRLASFRRFHRAPLATFSRSSAVFRLTSFRRFRRPLAAVPVPPPFSALPRFFLSFRRTRWNKARPKALSRLAPPGFLTGWWTGRPASPPRPPLVFAESPWLSGGGACKAATSAPEHGRFRRKRRSSPPYTPPGTTRARKSLALSRSQTVENPIGEAWRAKALQMQSEPGDMRGGFGSLAQQGFPARFPGRAPRRRENVSWRKRPAAPAFFDKPKARKGLALSRSPGIFNSLRPRAGLFDVPRRFRAAAATRYCRA